MIRLQDTAKVTVMPDGRVQVELPPIAEGNDPRVFTLFEEDTMNVSFNDQHGKELAIVRMEIDKGAKVKKAW